MQVSVEEHARWRRSLSVTVPSAAVAAEEGKAAQALAARLNMKGFRKGKVPPGMIESRFGNALRQETMDRVISDAYRTALKQEDLNPISEGELEDVAYEPGGDLVFRISFDVQPRFDPAQLGGFKIERPLATVEASHVDQVLARLQQQNGAWKPMAEGAPEDGDLVSLKVRRLDGIDEGERAAVEPRDYQIILGQGDAIPDIEAAIKTLALGETGEFTVAFPDDFEDEERRGSKETLEITLVERKERELPELDDGFAKQAGPFETLEELKSKVLEDLEKDAKHQAEQVVRARLLDALIEANPFDVPDSMIRRYVDSLLGDQKGLDPEKVESIHASLRPEAERVVKRLLMVDRIAETQSLEATEEDLDERIEKIAADNASTAAQVYAGLQKAGRLHELERDITERKVFDFLAEQSEITDVPAT
ncbi:MAG: trigger factor [Gemmatimonadota bacterium]|nr:trigger factor [Gemmatimonadota bacterium]MDH5760288.1 trigger factor [Gemmatimonadota bacterium]